MRYLKVFEYYNKEEELFQEITQQTYSDLLKNTISWDEDDISYLEKCGFELYLGGDYNLSTNSGDIIVNKLPDEWFLVDLLVDEKSEKCIYFKCDQWDGLKSCFSYITSKKIEFMKDMKKAIDNLGNDYKNIPYYHLEFLKNIIGDIKNHF